MDADPADLDWQHAAVRVVRRLHERVWSVEKAEHDAEVLGEVCSALTTLGVPACAVVVYLVKPAGEGPEVRYRELVPLGHWNRSAADEDVSAVIGLWSEGREARRSEGLIPCPAAAAAARRLGTEVHSLVEASFTQGVLGLYSQEPSAFGPSTYLVAEQIALVLSILYHRLADLDRLQTTERQLRQAQRLTLAGQLTAEAAAELCDPLSRVIGECELLLAESPQGDAADALEAINQAARQASSVSRRLLSFVRQGEPDMAWVSVNRIVDEAVELVRPSFAQEGIGLTTELGRNLPWVEAHSEQVQQVVLNLLQNSREALQGLRGRGHARGVVRVRTVSDGRSVVVEIEDNGPGIPTEIAQHVFEPFFTTKAASAGACLGLSLSAGIARAHGGELRLKRRTAGACLALRLPVRQPTPSHTN